MVETSNGTTEARNQPLFQELRGGDDQPDVTEMESLCMNCQESGTTRLLLTKIPFFKEIIIMSFDCPHCFHKDNSIKPGGAIQEKGVRMKLHVNQKQILDRQIVKQESASYVIEELNFEAPPFTAKGVLTTIEGLLETAIEGLDQQQPVRRIMDPDTAAKIDDVMHKLSDYKEGKNPFTLILEDISGNSYIENPYAPKPDPNLSTEHFERTEEQNNSLGLYKENNTEEEAEEKKDLNLIDEVLEFPSNCPSCQSPVITKMKQIDIPHFKQVIIMACSCDACGYKSNEVKAGGAIEPQGQKITLRMTDKTDLTRDILTSETCAVNVPDLELELAHTSLGGKFTTLEGLFVNFKEQLGTINPFAFGDSANKKSKMKELLTKVDQVIAGELFVTVILDDPVGNSYIQNLYAPDPDPELIIEKYERTDEQNEELGLTDMNTENYKT